MHDAGSRVGPASSCVHTRSRGTATPGQSGLCPLEQPPVLPPSPTHMRLTVPTGQLTNALDLASKVMLPASQQTGALAGVHMQVRRTSLQVICADGNNALAVTVEGASGRDGQVVLPAKPLMRYLSHLRADRHVTLEHDEVADSVTVTPDGGSAYTFRPLDGALPMPATLRGDATPISWQHLPVALAAVTESGNDASAVQLVSDDESLTLHATDSYMLVRARMIGGGFGAFTGQLAASTMKLLPLIAATGITIASDRRQLRFVGPRAVLSCRTLSVPFPVVESTLAQASRASVRFDRRDVRPAMQRLSAVAGDSYVTVEVGDEIALSVSNDDIGAGRETMVACDATDTLIARVRPSLLMSALAAMPTDDVTLQWISPIVPLRLSSATDGVEVDVLVAPTRVL
jgi:DNA polymerase III sliding clamp (beta) subunit (PCNA family)